MRAEPAHLFRAQFLRYTSRLSSTVTLSGFHALRLAQTVLPDGISYGMALFIISVGLTITMGLMRVANLAHGSFAMIGGYIAGYLTQRGYNFYLVARRGSAYSRGFSAP